LLRPILDILRELQFIAANENLGTVSVIPRQINAREISVRNRGELTSFPPPLTV
jgi:hypothetical protein